MRKLVLIIIGCILVFALGAFALKYFLVEQNYVHDDIVETTEICNPQEETEMPETFF